MYKLHRKQLYCCINKLCPNSDDLKINDDERLNYFLNSDGPIVKAFARFFYFGKFDTFHYSSAKIS